MKNKLLAKQFIIKRKTPPSHMQKKVFPFNAVHIESIYYNLFKSLSCFLFQYSFNFDYISEHFCTYIVVHTFLKEWCWEAELVSKNMWIKIYPYNKKWKSKNGGKMS
jgi:hypothetical protein